MKKYKTWDIYYTLDGPLNNLKVVIGQVMPTTPSRNRVTELARFETYEDAKTMAKKINQTLKEGRA